MARFGSVVATGISIIGMTGTGVFNVGNTGFTVGGCHCGFTGASVMNLTPTGVMAAVVGWRIRRFINA